MTRPLRLLALLVLAAGAACTSKSESSCPSGQERCNGFCVDTASYQADPANCGACGISCGTGTCAAGACACAPETLCPESNPRCADTQNDRLNCGGCGNVCPRPNEGCANGACDCVQGSAYPDDCTTYCTNFLTSAANCGGCGIACPLTNDICDVGSCRCPDGLPDVCNSTTCVNLATDTSNCRACGTACATGQTCTPTGCQCPVGESVCGVPGACVNRSTDEGNCGACGYVCPAGVACTSGSCACPATTPRLCGVPGAGGNCCTGTGCCANDACQTEHTNGSGVAGLGQHFYDCRPLGTYDLDQARAAAGAWQLNGSEQAGLEFSCAGCIGWHATVSSISYCGTWCYAGALAGRATLVQSLVCACPLAVTPNWN